MEQLGSQIQSSWAACRSGAQLERIQNLRGGLEESRKRSLGSQTKMLAGEHPDRTFRNFWALKIDESKYFVAQKFVKRPGGKLGNVLELKQAAHEGVGIRKRERKREKYPLIAASLPVASFLLLMLLRPPLVCPDEWNSVASTSPAAARLTLPQLWSFKIRRTTHLSYIKSANLPIKRLWILWQGRSGSVSWHRHTTEYFHSSKAPHIANRRFWTP